MADDKILLEYLSRSQGKFSLESVCFDRQIEYITSTAKNKITRCGRRAGKTYGHAVYLFYTAFKVPASQVAYMSITKDTAKALIWTTLLEINEHFNLGCTYTSSPPLITLPNKSKILILGADNEGEVRKARGFGFSLVIIDEVQNFRNTVLQPLVDDVLSKTLYDYDGTLVLSGTVPPVPVGYFWDCDQGTMRGSYEHFTWTMFDNPHIQLKSGKSPQHLLDQDLKKTGKTLYDPSIRREVFAEWATDTDALVFRYDYLKNDYKEAPPCTEFVVGVDIGFDDADAISVLGWSPNSPNIYLVDEHIRSGNTITDLATIVSEFIDKYNPLRVVMDTGGLGKKIAEEMRKRYALPILAAEKTRKFEYIELLNDALRTGKLKAKQSSQFAQDCMLVEWDKTNPDKLAIKKTFHSDITDSVLYAYREALHWLFVPSEKPIIKDTPEWYKKIEEELEKQALERMQGNQEPKEGLDPSE